MHNSFREAVLRFIREEKLICPGDRVIAAASGGADSMALLQLLTEEQEALGITLEAVHVDHRLRPESVKVADFVEDFCKKKGVPLHRFVSDAEIGHRSEEWSRDFRYGCFEQLAGPGVRIATAHTLSDQAETLLFRLARGTGVRGACGIPAKRGCYIRPMLTVTKRQTEEFCAQRGIDYIMDRDNLTDDYARNRIRHYALPALESANPRAQQAMGHFCARMTAVEQYLTRLGEHLLQAAACEGGWNTSILQAAEPVVLQTALCQLVEENRAFRDTDFVQLMNLLRADRGRLELEKGEALAVKNGLLYRDRGEKTGEAPFEPCPLCPGSYQFPGGFDLKVELLEGKECEENLKSAQFHGKHLKNWADYDKLTGSLILRTRRPGDHFRPGGRNVSKSLKKLFGELGIRPEVRELLPMAARDSEVLWLWGQGFAHGLRPDAETKRLLIVQPEENDNVRDRS